MRPLVISHRASFARRSGPRAIAFAVAFVCAGPLLAQQDADFGRRVGPDPNTSAARPVATGRLRGGSAEPVRAEHGYVNDVVAERMGVVPRVKVDSRHPDPGLPVDLPPHGQCRFEVSVEPQKLMPGATGKAKIVMALEGDSVLVSPDHLRLVAQPVEPGAAALQLGASAVLPPRPTGLAAAYRGRDVYDNWAIVEVPVTMPLGVPTGSLQSIRVDAVFDLHEGSTGRRFGQFRNPLEIVCEVGASPDPAVLPAAAIDRSKIGRECGVDGEQDAANGRTPSAGAGTATLQNTPGDDAATAPSAGVQLREPVPRGDWVLFGAGALLALAAGALLARRIGHR